MSKKNKYIDKYYVVLIGRKCGIYNSWEECKKQVLGFHGAVYKAFRDKKDAKEYIAGKV